MTIPGPADRASIFSPAATLTLAAPSATGVLLGLAGPNLHWLLPFLSDNDSIIVLLAGPILAGLVFGYGLSSRLWVLSLEITIGEVVGVILQVKPGSDVWIDWMVIIFFFAWIACLAGLTAGRGLAWMTGRFSRSGAAK